LAERASSGAYAQIMAPTKGKAVSPVNGGSDVSRSGENRSPAAQVEGGSSDAQVMIYHHGPVMTGTTNVYFIWYGTWTAIEKALVDKFVQNIGGTPYYDINTTYNVSGQTIANSVGLGESTSLTDLNRYGPKLNDTDVADIVTNAIAGGLPLDPTGLYLVMGGSDVSETSGFCKTYCSFHTHSTIVQGNTATAIKYGFVGDAARCPGTCAWQGTGPNSRANLAADAAVNLIAHELGDAVTDPELNAWYDRLGEENADKCAWTFGTTSKASNGSEYTIVVAGTEYLIQELWVNSGKGTCAMKH
jgi:hypothetical protein